MFDPNQPRAKDGKWTDIPGYIQKKIQEKEDPEVTKAEQFAIQNKLANFVDYNGLSPKLANELNEELLKAKKQFDLPALSEIRSVEKIDDQIHSLAAFTYSSQDAEKTLLINYKRMAEIENVGEGAFFNSELMKNFEAKNFKGIVRHEALHFVEKVKFGTMSKLDIISKAFQASKNLGYVSTLSKYSTINFKEFFSELGTAKFNGRELGELFTLNRHTKEDFYKIQALWDLL